MDQFLERALEEDLSADTMSLDSLDYSALEYTSSYLSFCWLLFNQ